LERVQKGIRIFYVSCSVTENPYIFLLVLTKKKIEGEADCGVVAEKLKRKFALLELIIWIRLWP